MDKLIKNGLQQDLTSIGGLFDLWHHAQGDFETNLAKALSESLLGLAANIAPVEVPIEAPIEDPEILFASRHIAKIYHSPPVEDDPCPAPTELRLADEDRPYNDWPEFTFNYNSEFLQTTQVNRNAYSTNRVPYPFRINNNKGKDKQVVFYYFCRQTNKETNMSRSYKRETDIFMLCQRINDSFNQRAAQGVV